mmetsp:Transcript_6485/g.9974  ORF Transcript_6485/g.9974 Transcript_6485/m.9974 type:complete len:85 (-) Transcript_6485:65-319(-)
MELKIQAWFLSYDLSLEKCNRNSTVRCALRRIGKLSSHDVSIHFAENVLKNVIRGEIENVLNVNLPLALMMSKLCGCNRSRFNL